MILFLVTLTSSGDKFEEAEKKICSALKPSTASDILLLQIASHPIRFRIFNAIILNFRYLSKICSFIAIYIIVLIQFELDDGLIMK